MRYRHTVIGCVIFISVMSVMLRAIESKLLFPAPRFPSGNWSPQDLEFEEIDFSSEDGVPLHGWFLPHQDPRAHVLFCYGNGEHVAFIAPVLKHLNEELNCSLFAFDYRGYGRSSGSPSEQGIFADSRAAHIKFAQLADIKSSEVVVMGKSLGGAVAVELAATRTIRGLVLLRTFTSIPDVASWLYPWFPVRWFMHSEFNSLHRIKSYDGPLLQGHGTADKVVPYVQGEQLFEASPSTRKQFVSIPGGTHNAPIEAKFFEAFELFLNAFP